MKKHLLAAAIALSGTGAVADTQPPTPAQFLKSIGLPPGHNAPVKNALNYGWNHLVCVTSFAADVGMFIETNNGQIFLQGPTQTHWSLETDLQSQAKAACQHGSFWANISRYGTVDGILIDYP